MIQSGAMRLPPVRILVPAAIALAALAGCATERMSPGLDATVLAAVIDYQCEGGIEMRVERAPDARSARVTIGSRQWVLTRVDSAAQEKYASGATALYLDGDAALLESEGRVLGANCKSTVALPRAPAMRPYKF